MPEDMASDRRLPEAAPGAQAYYDSYWETEGWNLSLPQKLLQLYTEHVDDSRECLDVGCGDGHTSGVWLSEHGGRYVGVDVSESAVQMAVERGLDARRIEDASELPFPDASFDVATSIEVLEHLFEPQKAVAEIHRVLRPGGKVIVTVPNAAHWRNRMDLTIFGRWNPRGDHLSASQPWRDAHIRFFTVRTLSDLLAGCGFDVVESGGFVEHPVLHHIPGLRTLSRAQGAGQSARRLAASFPRLLATNAYAVARKPAG